MCYSRPTAYVYVRNFVSIGLLLGEEAEASPSIANTVARLNDVRAFGYNSAGGERIWMKFGELRVYGLELSLANFERDPRRSGFGRKSRNFVFFSVH